MRWQTYFAFGGLLLRPPPEGLPVVLGQPPFPCFDAGGLLLRPPPDGLPVLLGKPPLLCLYLIESPFFIQLGICCATFVVQQVKFSVPYQN